MRRAAAPRRGPGRAARALLVLLVLGGLGAGLLAGCSGGDSGGGGGPTGDSTGGGDGGPLATTVTMGPVTGRLTPRQRTALTHAVGEVVDGWFTAAYLRDDPRSTAGDRFPGFTAGAVPRTSADRQVMSLGSLAGRIDGVTATRRAVRVEPLVVDGDVVGVTARFILEFDTTGDRVEHDTVRGRLLLTPHGDGWQIFGYDVAAGATGQQPTSASSSPEGS